jgi:hypothetical protein
MAMISGEDITRSVQIWWRDSFPPAVATIYPGQQIETSQLAEWVELWVDAWHDRLRRDVAPDELLVSITVHCFSRHPTQATKVQSLADGARAALARQMIDVLDFSVSGTPVVAQLRTREAETRDLTRSHSETTRGVLHHVVVTVTAVVQELVTAE